MYLAKKKRVAVIKTLSSLEGEPDRQIELLKRERAILNSELWTKAHEILDSSTDERVRGFLSAGDLLRKALDEAMEDVEKHQNLLEKISWETLLASFAVYLEDWYFYAPTDFAFHNKRYNLIPVLQRVSADKKRLERKGRTPKTWGGKRAVQAALDGICSRLQRGKPIDAYGLFRAWDNVLEVECIIKNYCLKGWGMASGSDAYVAPVTRDKWLQWITTNHKFQLIDRFYRELPFKAFPQDVDEIFSESTNEEEALYGVALRGGATFIENFLGVDKVSLDDSMVDVYDALKVIGGLDCHYRYKYVAAMQLAKSMGFTFQETMSQHEKIPESCVAALTFRELFNLALSVDQTLAKKVQSKAFRAVLELFADEPYRLAVDNGQFLKDEDDGYVIMPRFFHGDVKTALLNALVRKKSKENDERQFSLAQEKFLGERFASQGYSTLLSWEYDILNHGKGEVDLLAYKDGYLFVVEAKLTYFRNQLHGIYALEDTFEKAGNQLCRAMIAIEKEFASVKEALSIPIEHEELVVMPLIVSTTPEFDFEKYSGCHKLSQFELQGLLDPDSFVFMRAIMKLYNSETGIAFSRTEEEQLARSMHFQQDDEFILDFQRVQEQSVGEAEMIASRPYKLIEAIETKVFWHGLEENREILEGPAKSTMKLKNGDEIHYVI